MGGRGSAYSKLVKNVEKLIQEQNEKYDNNLKVDLADFINDIESEIHDEMFDRLKDVKVSTRKSTDEVYRNSLKINQKQVELIAKEFDYILNETSSDIQLGSENIKDRGTGGYTVRNIANGFDIRVVLDSKRLNDPRMERKETADSIRSNWHVPINIKEDARKYTITHEMGHVIENCIFEKLLKENRTNSRYYDTRWLAIKIRNEVENIAQNNYTKSGEKVKMNISTYSKENSMEWFAETFTNLVLADEPMPVALALRDYIESFKEKK